MLIKYPLYSTTINELSILQVKLLPHEWFLKGDHDGFLYQWWAVVNINIRFRSVKRLFWQVLLLLIVLHTIGSNIVCVYIEGLMVC